MPLPGVGQIIDQPFGLLPAQTGIGDGFAPDTAAGGLAAVLQIALHQKALDQRVDFPVAQRLSALHRLDGSPYALQVNIGPSPSGYGLTMRF